MIKGKGRATASPAALVGLTDTLSPEVVNYLDYRQNGARESNEQCDPF